MQIALKIGWREGGEIIKEAKHPRKVPEPKPQYTLKISFTEVK